MDCKRGPIEAWLKAYDARLYLKWNPKKNHGEGVWEVRIRPSRKTDVFVGHYQGADLYEARYVENDLTHHILDAKILDWSIPQKIYDMDTFRRGVKLTLDEREYEGDRATTEEQKKYRQELAYAVKQHKTIFRDWAKYVAQGQNPGQVLSKVKVGQ